MDCKNICTNVYPFYYTVLSTLNEYKILTVYSENIIRFTVYQYMMWVKPVCALRFNRYKPIFLTHMYVQVAFETILQLSLSIMYPNMGYTPWVGTVHKTCSTKSSPASSVPIVLHLLILQMRFYSSLPVIVKNIIYYLWIGVSYISSKIYN